jgi:hypothetical protein
MEITNRYNLPSAIVNNVLNDEYSKGDAHLSVTQLLNSPRIVLLQRVNEGKMSVDVVDRLPSMLGTAMHKVLEKGANPDEIVEERFFMDILGWKISGAVDLQTPKPTGLWKVSDYKLTSVYSVMVEKWEWEAQLNMYAYMMRETTGRRVDELNIVAILKDWNRKQGAFKPEYPEAPIVIVEIPVWPDEQQKEYIEGRVFLHQQAEKALDNGEPIAYCSDKERWLRGEKWAVMKKGRKSAVKLFDSEEEADEWIGNQDDRTNLSIEFRAGDPVRCSGDYCQVSRWCKQWLDEVSASDS